MALVRPEGGPLAPAVDPAEESPPLELARRRRAPSWCDTSESETDGAFGAAKLSGGGRRFLPDAELVTDAAGEAFPAAEGVAGEVVEEPRGTCGLR